MLLFANKLSLDDFQKKAYGYAEKYGKARGNREIFTYNVTPSVEEFHAKQAIDTADEFIARIREMMN